MQLGAPITLDHLDLQVVADGRHSVPTEITIVPDGDPSRAVVVPLPAVTDGERPERRRRRPGRRFPAITGSTFQVTVTGVRPELET